MGYHKLLDHPAYTANSLLKKYTPLIILIVLGLTLYFLHSGVPESFRSSGPVTEKNYDGADFDGSVVWDTMDGKGYQFAEAKQTPLDPRFYELLRLPSCGDLQSAGVQRDTQQLMEKVKKQFADCVKPIMEQWRGRAKEMNLEWVAKAGSCDNLPIMTDLKVIPFRNQHEIKWGVLPKCKEENIMVTLGVGHDTLAEEKLNRTVPNTKFYGADPIIEPNRQMYSAFGKFFPFAIGKEPGFTKFRVLPNQSQKTRKYIYQDVTTIPFLYFLHDILKLQKIDFAWIDIEGGEFEFLEKIHNDVQFCQFNVEIHSRFNPAGEQVFHDFMFKIVEDQKYVVAKNVHTGEGVHRMFFVNVQDPECVAKYYNKF